jgi:predicted RNA-binding protein with TRAM domain
MYQERRSFAPVREGDELDVKIEAVGEKGDGIAKKQGFVLFVPKTKAGDEVRIKVTKVLKNAGFAEVIGNAAPRSVENKPAKKEEEEFQPSTEKDSDDFGDESEAEDVAETAEEETKKDSDEEEEF